MASYKIYFLDFFHKNQPPSSKKCHLALQNATEMAVFVKKRVFVGSKGLFCPRLSWNNSCFYNNPRP